MNDSKICILILNYQSYNETINYIKELEKQQNVKIKFLVVDNCSPNNSFKKLKDHFYDDKSVDVIKTDKNGGYAYGNNVGIKYVIEHKLSEQVIISNNDIEIEDDRLICKLIEGYKTLPNDKAFVSPLMMYDDVVAGGAAKKLPALKDEIIHSSLLLKQFIGNKPDYIYENDSEYIRVDCLPGSFFLGATKIFEKIKFFDENTFLYGEERILGQKIKEIGLSNYLLPNLKFHHANSQTISRAFDRINRIKLKNESRIYYWKQYKKIKKTQLIMLRFFLKVGELEILVSTILRSIYKKK